MRSRTIRHLPMCAAVCAALMLTVQPSATAASNDLGWSEKQQAKRIKHYGRLTPEHFDDTITLSDDGLEVTASLSTEKGYRFKGGFSDPVRANVFLRTLINKQTGRTIHQLYASLRYSGNWRFFNGATYSTSVGPISAELMVINRDVDCQYGTCVHNEQVAFAVPESTLRRIAEGSDERPVQPWRFRFKAKNGLDWTDDIPPAEVAGLLMAVDRYRTQHGLQP